RGQREALLANAAARGVGGGGAGLAGALSAGETGAQNRYAQGLGVEALAQQNRLAATQALGNLGSAFENQRWNQASEAAKQADVISLFNAGNQQQTNLFNTGAQNTAAAANAQAGATAAGLNLQKTGQQLQAQQLAAQQAQAQQAR